MTTPTTTNSAKDSDALACARHFKGIMGSAQKGWIPKSRFLLDTYSLTPDELKEFMTWAATENTSDKPQFNSVEYLAKASDPMSSLVKNAPGLIRVWRVRQRAATAADADSWKTWKPTHRCLYCDHTASDNTALQTHALTHCTRTETALTCPRCNTEFPEREVLYHDCDAPKPVTVDDLYIIDRYYPSRNHPNPAVRSGSAFFYCITCGQTYPHPDGLEQMLQHIEAVHSNRLTQPPTAEGDNA